MRSRSVLSNIAVLIVFSALSIPAIGKSEGQTADTGIIQETSNWELVLRPFGYSPWLDTSLDVGDLSVDYDGTNFISIVNFFLQGDAELHYKRFYLYGEVNYYDVSDTTTVKPISPLPGEPINGSGYFSMSGCTCTIAVGYKMAPYRDIDWSIYSGARIWDFDTKLRLNDPNPVEIRENGSLNFIDPIIGFKANYDLSEHAMLRLRSDIGGFGVGSDFQNDSIIEYGYRLTENTSALLGFRSFYVTGEDHGGATTIDAWYYGPQISLEMTF